MEGFSREESIKEKLDKWLKDVDDKHTICTIDLDQNEWTEEIEQEIDKSLDELINYLNSCSGELFQMGEKDAGNMIQSLANQVIELKNKKNFKNVGKTLDKLHKVVEKVKDTLWEIKHKSE